MRMRQEGEPVSLIHPGGRGFSARAAIADRIRPWAGSGIRAIAVWARRSTLSLYMVGVDLCHCLLEWDSFFVPSR